MTLTQRERILLRIGQSIIDKSLNLPPFLHPDMERELRRRKIMMIGNSIGINRRQLELHIEEEEEKE